MYYDDYLDKEIKRLKTGKNTKLIRILIAWPVVFLLEYMISGFDSICAFITIFGIINITNEFDKRSLVRRIFQSLEEQSDK